MNFTWAKASWALAIFVVLVSFAVHVRAQEAERPKHPTETERSINELFELLRSDDPNLRLLAARQLCAKGRAAEAAMPKLIELLDDQAVVKGIQIRYYLPDLLASTGRVSVDSLMVALSHDSRNVRIGAADALGKLQSKRAVGALIECLGDAEGEVASQASTSLVMIGEASIDPLVKVLESNDTKKRQFAAGALGGIRDKRSVRPVAKLLFDPDPKTREWAAYSLYRLAQKNPLGTTWPVDPAPGKADKLRDEREAALRKLVCDELNLALASDNTAARIAATQCCRQVMSVDTLEGLAKCLSDDDAVLRTEAVEAIMVTNDPSILKLLLRALEDSNNEVRAAAANGLRFRGGSWYSGEELIDPLIKALRDSDHRVRQNAAEALANLQTQRKRKAAPEVIKLLQDSNEEVIRAALRSLVELKDAQAVEPIHALLSKPTFHLQAASALASFRDPRSIEPLRAVLKDKDPNVIRALGILKDRESVYPLIALLGEKDESIRREAATALGEIGDIRAIEPLSEALQSDRDLLHVGAEALSKIGHPHAVWPLLNAAKIREFHGGGLRFRAGNDDLEDDPHRHPVAWPLFNMGEAAIEPLAGALTDEAKSVRGLAAWVLYNLTSQGGLEPEDFEPAVEPLAAALTDSAKVVRFHAAMALGNLKDPRAIDVLIEVAAASDDRSLYGNAAGHLSRIGDRRCVPPLIGLLTHEKPKARTTAVNGLGWIGDKRAIEPLLARLMDNDEGVVAAAAEALGNLKAREAVKPLKELLASEKSAVRVGAAQGLGRLGDPSAADAIAQLDQDRNFDVRVAAAIALLRLKDPRGVDAIARCLKDSEPKNREQAATKVSSAFLKRDDGLVAVLAEALNDDEIRVRLYVAGALSHIGTKEAVDALIAKLDDRENLQSVLKGIIHSKDSRAFELAVKYLDDSEAEIRALAAYGLGELNPPAGAELLIGRLGDPAPKVRIAVIDALAQLRVKQSLEPLKRTLDDENHEVRSRARRAIRKIDST